MELAKQFIKQMNGTHLWCAIVWDGEGFRLYRENMEEYKVLVKDDARTLSCLVGVYSDPDADSLYDDMDSWGNCSGTTTNSSNTLFHL